MVPQVAKEADAGKAFWDVRGFGWSFEGVGELVGAEDLIDSGLLPAQKQPLNH